MKPTHPARVSLVLALTLLPALSAASQAHSQPPEWTQIDDSDGIKVWQLAIPGMSLPGFRGEALIDAAAERIASVIKEVEHHTAWMKNCSAAGTVRRFDDDHVIVYNRTDAPWPVWDRDVVLDTQFTYEPGKITLVFRNTDPKLYPLPERTVRMPRLQGSYELTRVGPTQTRVRYTVEADVGGSLPAWVAKRLAKEMPYETLNRLRARVLARK